VTTSSSCSSSAARAATSAATASSSIPPTSSVGARSAPEADLLGLLLGLAGALAWGFSGLVGSRSTRLIGTTASLAWGILAGFAVVVAPALWTVPRHRPPESAMVWLAVGGVASFLGLWTMLQAYRTGALAIVAPIIATEGAVIAVLDVAFGGALSPVRAVMLALATLGVVVVARGQAATDGGVATPPVAIVAAVAAALLYGVGLFAAAEAASDVGPFFPSLVTRVIGMLLLALPVLVRTRGRVPSGRGRRFALLGGALDMSGMLLYVGSARAGSAAVAGVLVSQAAAVSALLGIVVLGERLARAQVIGFAMIAVAVTALGYGV
jgi:drug/metabolite transporter (DMT)-like permease